MPKWFFINHFFYICTVLTDSYMRITAKKRIIIAWLLFMVFMPFFLVKTIHQLEESDASVCHSKGESSQNVCHQCPICKFTLSPFTQVESFYFEVIIPVFNYEPVYEVNMMSYRPILSSKLRAPPFLSTLS